MQVSVAHAMALSGFLMGNGFTQERALRFLTAVAKVILVQHPLAGHYTFLGDVWFAVHGFPAAVHDAASNQADALIRHKCNPPAGWSGPERYERTFPSFFRLGSLVQSGSGCGICRLQKNGSSGRTRIHLKT